MFVPKRWVWGHRAKATAALLAFQWLRDDEREDEDMLAYLNAENEYTDARLAHLSELPDRSIAPAGAAPPRR